MILHVLADASYLSRSRARSFAGAYLFIGDHLQPTKINDAIHCFSTIIPCVVASAGEAEYTALFATGQQAAALRTILEEIGYPNRQQSFFAITPLQSASQQIPLRKRKKRKL
jgi:hypothetical protein